MAQWYYVLCENCSPSEAIKKNEEIAQRERYVMSKVKFDKLENWMSIFIDHQAQSCSKLTESKIIKTLNSRDKKPFDSEWCIAYDDIEVAMNQLSVKENNDINKIARNYCSLSFDKIIRLKNSTSDLAAYVAEDAELIFKCLAIRNANSFIFGLILSYINGEIPHNGMIKELSIPSEVSFCFESGH